MGPGALDAVTRVSTEHDLAAAIALFNEGRLAQAERRCAAVIERDAHPGAYQLLAVLLRARGALDEALQAIETSLQLRPSHRPSVELAAGLHHAVGMARHARADLTGAHAAFARSVELAPASSESWFALSLVQQDLRDPESARDALQHVLALQPGHLRATVNLGIIEQQLGSLDAALPHYREAYRQDPKTLPRLLGALCSERCGCLWLDVGIATGELSA